jgi:hypothetical protein
MVTSWGAVPAWAQGTQTITVVLTEYQFNPNTVPLTLGQPVQLNIQNKGKLDHNLSSDELPISNVNYIKADNSSSDLHRYEATSSRCYLPLAAQVHPSANPAQSG